MSNAELLKAAKEAPFGAWLLLAAVSALLAIVILFRPGWIPQPYPNTRAWITLVAWITLPTVFLWSVWKIVTRLRAPRWAKKRRLVSRWNKLNAEQRALLAAAYTSGQERYDVSEETSRMRWFNDLERGGFIIIAPSMVYFAGMRTYFSVTPESLSLIQRATSR